MLTGIPAGVVTSDVLHVHRRDPGGHAATQPRDPAGQHAEVRSACVGGDVAGFPNGRRVTDDVVTIELQAIAGATIPLVDKSYTPDKAIADVSDGDTGAGLTFLPSFPYLGTPYSGYNTPA